MRSSIEIDTESPEELLKILEPDLEKGDRVSTTATTENSSVRLETETDSLGTLRGSTDGLLRLSSLAEKIIREE